MATAAEITVQARIQAAVVKSALAEMRGYWTSLNLAKPEAARDALLEFMPYLNGKYGTAAGSAAATFYDELRDGAGVAGRYRATVLAFDPEPTVTATRRIAGELFDDNPQSALVGLGAMVNKQVLNVGRNTTTTSAYADPRSPGWHREIRGDTCGFCRMLASRGAVYKKATASFAAHSSCDCVALPSWDGSAPEANAKQYEASQRLEGLRKQARGEDVTLSKQRRKYLERRGLTAQEDGQMQLDAHRARIAGYVEDFKD